MTLSALIDEEYGGSQKAFATAADVDEGQLSKYLAAERGEVKGQRPGADNIARIERATEGRITAQYWMRLRNGDSAQQTPKNHRSRSVVEPR